MTAHDDAPGPEVPLEQGLDRLEEIARLLERGELPLEQSLELFTEGMALSRRLETRLADAEMKVEALVREADGGERAVPFNPPEDAP